jgi:putative addiction module component (TIGR02574 family)
MSQPLGDEAQRLLAQALALPEEERQTLVTDLAASLSAANDPTEDPAVLAELADRFARYERGESPARPWPQVREEIEARLRTLRATPR